MIYGVADSIRMSAHVQMGFVKFKKKVFTILQIIT